MDNKYRNFITFSREQFQNYIEKQLIKSTNELLAWYNKNNCICIDIRDDITNLNAIHCALFEQYDYNKNNFIVLCYDEININGDIMTDIPHWVDFIVLYDNGEILKCHCGEMIDIDFVDTLTGECVNKIHTTKKPNTKTAY